MAEFPLEPSYSTLLLGAITAGCVDEMLTITSMLSAEELWIRYPDKEKQVLYFPLIHVHTHVFIYIQARNR